MDTVPIHHINQQPTAIFYFKWCNLDVSPTGSNCWEYKNTIEKHDLLDFNIVLDYLVHLNLVQERIFSRSFHPYSMSSYFWFF